MYIYICVYVYIYISLSVSLYAIFLLVHHSWAVFFCLTSWCDSCSSRPQRSAIIGTLDSQDQDRRPWRQKINRRWFETCLIFHFRVLIPNLLWGVEIVNPYPNHPQSAGYLLENPSRGPPILDHPCMDPDHRQTHLGWWSHLTDFSVSVGWVISRHHHHHHHHHFQKALVKPLFAGHHWTYWSSLATCQAASIEFAIPWGCLRPEAQGHFRWIRTIDMG